MNKRSKPMERFLLWIAVSFTSAAGAQSWGPIPSFGVDGIAGLAQETHGGQFRAIAVQSDGKILCAGHTAFVPYEPVAIVVRFRQNGTLDTTFGTNGVAVIDLATTDMFRAIAIQPDGKILAAGETGNFFQGLGELLVVRLLPNGDPDPSFGTNGVRIIDLEGANESIASIALQSDGKILATGYMRPAINDHAVPLIRLTASGELDSTFAINGVATLLQANIRSREGRMIGVQTDGKILLCGSYQDAGFAVNRLLARYTPSGVLDTSFNDSGLVLGPPIEVFQEWLETAVIQEEDDRIITAGYVEAGSYDPVTEEYVSNNELIATRYNTDGSVDVTYGTDGTTTLAVGLEARMTAAFRRPDGSLVVCGTNWAADESGVGVIVSVLDPSGQPDLAFGINGTARVDLGPVNIDVFGCAGASNGDVFVVGSMATSISRVILLRLGELVDVGMDQREWEHHLEAYPNPFHDRLTYRTTDKSLPVVHNALGVKVPVSIERRIIHGDRNELTLHFPPNLSPGLYTVHSPGSRTVSRVLKE